ncbi:hypothetical protein [Pseudooceanicola nitratireducens]|uniref:hypothetical protein n=1 Tax=Pseudooceanicola nitratireducens TaxID=517719 RepID=UPI001C95D2BB|nr:hypothetical protein [Pseudooceanicola nitratireducens]MBY6157249.1 hypothetical protein [Pseudooceanicola nitratireducens]
MNGILEQLAHAGKLLPITVVVAIVLFVVKEGLEARRRLKANERKRKAVRRLIADEIERNHWTIKRLRDGVSEIESHILKDDSALMIRASAIGERYFRREEGGQMAMQFPIGRVHAEALSSNLLALAEIDEAIFEEALKASDALKELDHVLKSMIEHLSNDNDRGFLKGFADYAKRKIADCEKTLQGFYKNVTSRALEEHRVR